MAILVKHELILAEETYSQKSVSFEVEKETPKRILYKNSSGETERLDRVELNRIEVKNLQPGDYVGQIWCFEKDSDQELKKLVTYFEQKVHRDYNRFSKNVKLVSNM